MVVLGLIRFSNVSQLLLPDKDMWSLWLSPGCLRMETTLTSPALPQRNPITSWPTVNRARHLPSFESQTRSSARQCGIKKESGEGGIWEMVSKPEGGEKDWGPEQRTDVRNCQVCSGFAWVLQCLPRKQSPILSRRHSSWKLLVKVSQHYDPVACISACISGNICFPVLTICIVRTRDHLVLWR